MSEYSLNSRMGLKVIGCILVPVYFVFLSLWLCNKLAPDVVDAPYVSEYWDRINFFTNWMFYSHLATVMITMAFVFLALHSAGELKDKKKDD